MSKQIFVVQPRGFCAGVSRAIKILDLVLEKTNSQVYVRHQIIHNRRVVRDYEDKGVIFVEELSEIPDGSVVVLSAHGTPPDVFEQAKKKNLIVVDGVCPLVTKVHMEAKRLSDEGYFVIYIGHKGHQEAIGVLGEVLEGRSTILDGMQEVERWEAPEGVKKLGVLTQTTLNADVAIEMVNRLKSRFPNIKLPPGGDICYATKGRQDAVIELAKQTEIVIVVGSKESSNSNKLKDRAIEQGVTSYLVDDVSQVNKEWFKGKERIGVTAGASGPDYLVEEIVGEIKKITDGEVEELLIGEDAVVFGNLPKELEEL